MIEYHLDAVEASVSDFEGDIVINWGIVVREWWDERLGENSAQVVSHSSVPNRICADLNVSVNTIRQQSG